MTDAPAPLVSAEVDLRGLQYMPLYIERLQKSKAWLVCKRKPELAFHMLNLWMRAWHEVPAGSIEDDDDVLADAAMCEPRRWGKVKADVLRGWVRCADGRLYHPVVAEFATQAWQERIGFRERTAKARQAKQQRRDDDVTDDATKPATTSVTKSVTTSVTDTETGVVTAVKGREGKGSESPLPPLSVTDDLDRVRQVVWRQAGKSDDEIATKLASASGEGIRQTRVWLEKLPADEVIAEVERAFQEAEDRGERLRNPWVYLDRVIGTAVERKAAEASAGAFSGERGLWRARLNDWRNRRFWLPMWGPEPGQPGCEAPPDLVAEILGIGAAA